jgi:2-keto-4-pentenoate hydratase
VFAASRFTCPIPLPLAIADFGGNGIFVRPDAALETTPQAMDLMTSPSGALRINGAMVAEYGAGESGAPLDRLVWLVNRLSAAGIGLPEGAFVLSGSLTGPPHPISDGDVVELEDSCAGLSRTSVVNTS